MDARHRRISVWKLIGLIAASLVGMLLILFIWVSVVGNQRHAAMQEKLGKLVAETEARDASRQALRGKAMPGNAWEDYAIALKEVDAGIADRTALSQFVDRAPKADRAKVESHLAAHGVALDHLRRGASRSIGQFRERWENEVVRGLMSLVQLANLAACKSRFLIEEGKIREAADLLLDTCQFARDAGFNRVLISEIISFSIYGIAFEEIRVLLLSGKLAREDLLEVEGQLEIIDRSFPPHSYSLLNESVFFGFGLSRAEPPWLLQGVSRLMSVDAFEKFRDFMKRRAEAEEKSWAEVQKIEGELIAEAERLWNPIAKIWVPGIVQSSRDGRERRAQLRLLRVAAHYLATREILDLDDPFGAKLHSSKNGETLKVWSVGREGVDHGGVGEWKPVTPGRAAMDIVLDIRR